MFLQLGRGIRVYPIEPLTRLVVQGQAVEERASHVSHGLETQVIGGASGAIKVIVGAGIGVIVEIMRSLL